MLYYHLIQQSVQLSGENTIVNSQITNITSNNLTLTTPQVLIVQSKKTHSWLKHPEHSELLLKLVEKHDSNWNEILPIMNTECDHVFQLPALKAHHGKLLKEKSKKICNKINDQYIEDNNEESYDNTTEEEFDDENSNEDKIDRELVRIFNRNKKNNSDIHYLTMKLEFLNAKVQRTNEKILIKTKKVSKPRYSSNNIDLNKNKNKSFAEIMIELCKNLV